MAPDQLEETYRDGHTVVYGLTAGVSGYNRNSTMSGCDATLLSNSWLGTSWYDYSDAEVRRRYREYVAAYVTTRRVVSRRQPRSRGRVTQSSRRSTSLRLARHPALATTRAHRRAVRRLLAT